VHHGKNVLGMGFQNGGFMVAPMGRANPDLPVARSRRACGKTGIQKRYKACTQITGIWLPQIHPNHDSFRSRVTLEPFSFMLNQWKGSMVLFLPQNAWLKCFHFNQLCSSPKIKNKDHSVGAIWERQKNTQGTHFLFAILETRV